MKKIFTLLFLVVLFTGLKAQVVFQENFDAVADGAMPTGWTLFNLDGLTPSTSLTANHPYDQAWNCYAQAGMQITSKCAWSVSWFTAAAIANRWMFTPAIVIPATNPVVQYLVVAQDPAYPDGYELRIMTTAPTAANIMTSTVLSSVTAAPSTPTTMSVNLSAYAGQTVYIGWRNNSNDKFLLAVDDVVVKSLSPINATLSSINTASYVVAGNTNVTGTIANNGGNAITSYDVTYKVDGGAASAVYSVAGANIASLATATFTHNIPANLAVGQHAIQVTISNVNGGVDGDTTDNVLTKTVNVLSSIPTKRVFCEEATGTWCGYCVRGIVYMGQMETAHPTDWVGVAVHNADPMVVTEWDAGIGAYPGFTGYPTIIVDRTLLDDPSNAAACYTTQKAVVSPVDVNIANVTNTAGVISFDVKATPVTTGTVDWRIDGAVYEMDVTWQDDAAPTTDSTTFQQHNYYAANALGAMGGFESLPAVIPANYMHYNFVNRALLGGFSGTASSIPASIVDGTVYTQNYTYTIPAYQHSWNLRLVGFVIDQATGKVLNSIQVPLSAAGITENNSSPVSIKMYPNPSKGIVNISGITGKSQITVTDVFGKTVLIVENTKVVDLSNYSNGIYFIRVNSNNNITTEKVILNK